MPTIQELHGMTDREAAQYDAAADREEQAARLLQQVSDEALRDAYTLALQQRDTESADRYANEAARRGMPLWRNGRPANVVAAKGTVWCITICNRHGAMLRGHNMEPEESYPGNKAKATREAVRIAKVYNVPAYVREARGMRCLWKPA